MLTYMMDRNMPAVLVLNNKANMEMRDDNPVLIEKDNTSKPTLVLLHNQSEEA